MEYDVINQYTDSVGFDHRRNHGQFFTPFDVTVFMGSGSTAKAALRCGRLAIGFEINDNYIQLAEQRLTRL